jgi:threonine/homoserine/homoserine lactone efflux protein
MPATLERSMLTFLVLGAGIGFVSGVSPGPVLTLVVSETLRGGWLRGAAVAIGPLVADGPIILAAVLLVDRVPDRLVPAISVIGGIFLLYLAVTTALTARHATLPKPGMLRARGGILTGLLARALGPHPYVFWFLVGGPTLVHAQQQSSAAVAAFLIGYYATIVGSNVGVAFALHRWMRLLSERVYRAVLFVASLLLASYGLVFMAQATEPRATSP